eukprot:CAMPEP_0196597666 /NCGR_PEP_ID=MMETSP1081-20130531/92434_1 /TAXON_ID=36882 /ORGANISM="Pyramimonas amylifera, Strain CCMP720" /LENGTH=94 /DNA_ID=CAMNT_0041923151 /DNA_START=383 /DNA_END=663 /DNA_ORIENTATION=+
MSSGTPASSLDRPESNQEDNSEASQGRPDASNKLVSPKSTAEGASRQGNGDCCAGLRVGGVPVRITMRGVGAAESPSLSLGPGRWVAVGPLCPA